MKKKKHPWTLESPKTTTTKIENLSISIATSINTQQSISKNQRKKRNLRVLKYCKYNKVGHLTKNCRSEQKIKNKSIQEETDKKDNDKEKSFVKGLEQTQYNEPLYIINL